MLEFFQNINFINPSALLGFILVPVLFIILKSFPPKPSRITFSSLFIIKKIKIDNSKILKYPIWLLLFRILILALVIAFFSEPYFKNKSFTNNQYKNYIIFLDSGWSASSKWGSYKNVILDIASEAEKNKSKLYLINTSRFERDDLKFFYKKENLAIYLNKLKPEPLQIKRINKNDLLFLKNKYSNLNTFALFSKFDSKDIEEQNKYLSSIKKIFPDVKIISPQNSITIIDKVDVKNEAIFIKLKRFGDLNTTKKIKINILGNNNEIFYNKIYKIPAGRNFIEIKEDLPIDLINRTHKIKLINESHAASVFYFDDANKQKRIAIVSDNSESNKNPLLSPNYYIKKALLDYKLIFGTLEEILTKNPNLIICSEDVKINDEYTEKINSWIEKGGILIRFSGPKSKKTNLFLSDKNIQKSIRTIGGDLSLSKKVSIKDFSKTNIFYGINTKNKIKFKKQLILYETENIKTLIFLNDNTPLISAKDKKKGKIILFHVTANNDWSDLPFSSLFKDILNRILLFSETPSFEISSPLKISKKIDQNGNLSSPDKIVYYNPLSDLKENYPNKKIPPGIYENNTISYAINLSGRLNLEPFYNNIDKQYQITNSYKNDSVELKKYILNLIVLFFLLDVFISILIKNNLNPFQIKYISKYFTLVIFISMLLEKNVASNELTNNIYFAYVSSKNLEVDEIVFKGLSALKAKVSERTAVEISGVRKINLKQDDIFYYPLIYWPFAEPMEKLDKKTKIKLKNYFDNGGVIFFDFFSNNRKIISTSSQELTDIRSFLSFLDINELKQLSKNHTLTKSFYLLKNFPGRWNNKILLLDNKDLEIKDGVSSVILGFNSWASAWALDKNNYPLFPLAPSGEKQRELAYRFGINVLIYSLTGNYKSDQVHSKSILKRLKKE